MPPSRLGRKIGLLAGLATCALAASAPAATVTITSFSGENADLGANRPNHRTEDRTPTLNFDLTGSIGDQALCDIDDNTPDVVCATLTINGTQSFSYTPASQVLGGHSWYIDTAPTALQTRAFRIEPPQYYWLIQSYGPKGYWELDDAADASVATDASGNGYHGDYKNFPIKRQVPAVECEDQPHPTYACDWGEAGAFPATLDPYTGQPAYSGVDGATITTGGRDSQGWSAYFGGRDDHVQIEDMTNGTSTSWAIEAWVKPGFFHEERGVFQHVPSLWTVEGSTATTTRFACSGLNDEAYAVQSPDISQANFENKWLHVVCKYSAGSYTLYVQGSGVDTKTAGAAGPSYSPPNGGAYKGLIGLVNKAADLWWNGWIDNVALYSSHSPMSDDAVDFEYEVATISELRYIANANGQHADQAPPTVGDVTMPQNNHQFSKQAQAYKDPTSAYACTDPDVADVGETVITDQINGAGYSNPFLGALSTNTTNTFWLTCADSSAYRWTHKHTFYVHDNPGFANLIQCLNPGTVGTPTVGCSRPLAYFRLNEGPTATVLDDELNVYDGEFKNRTGQGGTGISGDATSARQFFGNDYGYAAVNNIAAPLWGYTLEGWWKPADHEPMMIMQHGSNGAIWFDGDFVRFRPDERGLAAVSSVPIVAGNWYYVAGTYDGITGKLYVDRSINDGNQALTAPAVVPVHYQDGAGSADTFYLGYGDQLGGGGWLRGELDEVAYYASALSQGKLEQHFNADPPAGDVRYAAMSAPRADRSKAKAKRKQAKARAKARAKALAKARAKAKAKRKAKRRPRRH